MSDFITCCIFFPAVALLGDVDEVEICVWLVIAKFIWARMGNVMRLLF